MSKNLLRSMMTLLLIAAVIFGIVSGSGIEKVSAAAAKPGKAKFSVKVNDDGKSVTLTIGKTADAAGYKILVEKPGSDGFVKLATLKKDGTEERTYVAKNLSAGEYSFMVRSYLKSGKKTVWGKYSKIITVTIGGSDEGKEKIDVGYITKEYTIIETENFVFEIEPNIYVCPGMAEKADGIFRAMEKVTGRNVKDGKYHNRKIKVYVNRYDAEKFDPLYENGGSHGGTLDLMWIAPSDLFVADGYSFTHYLADAFYREFCNGVPETVLGGGFRCYEHLKIIEYLQENDPDLAAVVGNPDSLKNNLDMNYDAMYEQPVEYWIAHFDEAYSFSTNGQFALGFRLMGYLEKKFGDCTAWFETYDELATARAKKEKLNIPDELSEEIRTEVTIQALKKAYGKNVFKNFYSWMKKNEGGRFDADNYYSSQYDITGAKEYTIFPDYMQFSNFTIIDRLEGIIYNDLTVNIAPAEFYLREYKNEDTSGLILHVSEGTTVELYDYDNNLTDTVQTTAIPLSGVAAVKLVGTGKTEFSITGYNIYKSW